MRIVTLTVFVSIVLTAAAGVANGDQPRVPKAAVPQGEPIPAPVPGAVAVPSTVGAAAIPSTAGAPAPGTATAAVPGVSSARKTPSGTASTKGMPYFSPMREQCMLELRKDAKWEVDLKKILKLQVHEAEAELVATNNRHVIMAYVAFWVLVVIFVALMWLRQRKLVVQIDELKRQVSAAAQ